MLIAIITILFLGGSSSGVLDYIADAEDNVKQVIAKGDQRTGALATLKALKKTSKARNKQVKRAAKALDKAREDHAGGNAEVDGIWSELFVELGEHNSDMLDLRFELKDQINREDWEKIFPVE